MLYPLRDIATYREIFISHLYLAPPEHMTLSEFCVSDSHKTKMIRLRCGEETTTWYVKPFRQNTRTWRTDRQTDGQNCYINIARHLVCWRAIKTIQDIASTATISAATKSVTSFVPREKLPPAKKNSPRDISTASPWASHIFHPLKSPHEKSSVKFQLRVSSLAKN